MINRVPQNAVLVELEKVAEDEYQLASGVRIYMDTSYRPEHHQRIYGKCVAVPGILTRDGGLVRYNEGDFKYLDSIEPEVKVGDTVYFNYTVVNKMNLIEYEGKSYYKVDYSSIICVVRSVKYNYSKKEAIALHEFMGSRSVSEETKDLPDEIISVPIKTIIPIGGNILCEEYFGKDATSVEVEGRKIHGEVSSSGLITKIIHKAPEDRAVVRITGTPLKGDNMEVESGDVIIMPNKFGFKNNIEGKDYLVIKYWDIQAVVGNVNTESVI